MLISTYLPVKNKHQQNVKKPNQTSKTGYEKLRLLIRIRNGVFCFIHCR